VFPLAEAADAHALRIGKHWQDHPFGCAPAPHRRIKSISRLFTPASPRAIENPGSRRKFDCAQEVQARQAGTRRRPPPAQMANEPAIRPSITTAIRSASCAV
jgi:hypothetical protein